MKNVLLYFSGKNKQTRPGTIQTQHLGTSTTNQINKTQKNIKMILLLKEHRLSWNYVRAYFSMVQTALAKMGLEGTLQ